MDIKLPFSTTGMMLHLDDGLDYEILTSSIESMSKNDRTEDEIVLEAMANPIGSPKLSELADYLFRPHKAGADKTHYSVYAQRDQRRKSGSKDYSPDRHRFSSGYHKRRAYWQVRRRYRGEREYCHS